MCAVEKSVPLSHECKDSSTTHAPLALRILRSELRCAGSSLRDYIIIIKQSKMTGFCAGIGVVWLNILHLTGLLRRLAMTGWRASSLRDYIIIIKQPKMTGFCTSIGVVWLNMLHFSGLLRRLAMTATCVVIARSEVTKQSREIQYAIIHFTAFPVISLLFFDCLMIIM